MSFFTVRTFINLIKVLTEQLTKNLRHNCARAVLP